MSIYQKSKSIIYQGAQSLNEKLERKSVKKVKRITIIIFATLIVLDVVFVLPTPFPTFSRVVLDSSPRYMFIIWLWGIMTANIFFTRNVAFKFTNRLIALVLMILISLGLYLVGNNISNSSSDINCENIQSETVSTFSELVCYNSDDAKIDCNETEGDCFWVKHDISTMSKLSLLIFGFLYGYFFWPQIEREP
jgi:small-conductance mechanosensitive channel